MVRDVARVGGRARRQMFAKSVGWTLLAAWLVACAPVQRTQVFVDDPIASSVTREVVESSTTYSARASVTGDLLVVMLSQAQRCAVVTTPRKVRDVHVTRHLDSKFMNTAWALALGGMALGGFMYWDATSLSDMDHADDPTSTSTPDDYKQVGSFFAIGGTVVGVIAIGNLLRGGSSVEDGGIVSGNASREERPCRERPTADEPVSLRFATGTKLDAGSGRDGRVEFSLTSITEPDLQVGGALTLEIGGEAHVDLALSDDELDEIRSMLTANPDSRLSQDKLAARQHSCRSAVLAARDAARGNVRDHAEEVMDLWGVARQTCGNLWSADDAAGETASRAETARIICESALGRVAAITTDASSRDEVHAALVELERADSVCGTDARTVKARGGYLLAAKRVEESERAESERRAMQAELEALESVMTDDEPERAYRMLAANPRLKAAASSDTRDVATDLLIRSIDNVLDDSPSKSEAARRMCFARNTFKILVGTAALRTIVQRFVARVGVSDPAYASRVVRAIKAGSCR